jgi:hypothetical protein
VVDNSPRAFQRLLERGRRSGFDVVILDAFASVTVPWQRGG